MLQLAANRAQRQPRIVIPPIARCAFSAGSRENLARLRAAELAAWEASGGDYLLSPLAE